MFDRDIYACMTTIPPRVGQTLKKALDSLLSQDYKYFKGIFLIIPTVNMRGFESLCELPPWLVDTEPYKSKVTIVRPSEDHGPIMKWIGVCGLLPVDSWVFICDDDQEYYPDYVSQLVQKTPVDDEDVLVTPREVYEPLLRPYTVMFGMKLVTGWSGVLTSQRVINYIAEHFDRSLPDFCKRIDDDVVSVIVRDGGFRVIAIAPIFETQYVINAIKKSSTTNGLSATTNPWSDRHNCHKLINGQIYNRNMRYGKSALIIWIICAIAILWIYFYSTS